MKKNTGIIVAICILCVLVIAVLSIIAVILLGRMSGRNPGNGQTLSTYTQDDSQGGTSANKDDSGDKHNNGFTQGNNSSATNDNGSGNNSGNSNSGSNNNSSENSGNNNSGNNSGNNNSGNNNSGNNNSGSNGNNSGNNSGDNGNNSGNNNSGDNGNNSGNNNSGSSNSGSNSSLADEYMQIFKEYCNGYCPEEGYLLGAYGVDVTHDSLPELIMIEEPAPGMFTMKVFQYYDGLYHLIDQRMGGDSHMAGFFGVYLVEVEDGYDILYEVCEMWQGMGEMALIEYYLIPGAQTPVTFLVDVECQDSPITDEQYDAYVQGLNSYLHNAMLIGYDFSEGDGIHLSVDPKIVVY